MIEENSGGFGDFFAVSLYNSPAFSTEIWRILPLAYLAVILRPYRLICSIQPGGSGKGPVLLKHIRLRCVAVVPISVHQKDLVLSGVRPLLKYVAYHHRCRLLPLSWVKLHSKVPDLG